MASTKPSTNGKPSPGKRRCTEKTKAGKPCKAPPLAGTKFCISHSSRAVQEKAGFGGPENASKGGSAKRVPRLTEILAAKVEARADEIIEKLLEGLEAKRAVVVGNGADAYVEIVDDRTEVLKTIREVFDRIEGRPKTTAEITHVQADELDREIEQLMAEMAAREKAKAKT
jgi:hypothetical protein